MYKPKARRQLLAALTALGILFFGFSRQVDQPVGMCRKRVNTGALSESERRLSFCFYILPPPARWQRSVGGSFTQ